MPRPRGRYWRGDVLRLLVAFGQGSEEKVVAISGFGWDAPLRSQKQVVSDGTAGTASAAAAPLAGGLQATIYSATITRIDTPDATRNAFDQQQQRLKDAVPAALLQMPAPPPLPPWQPLSSQRRLINLAEKHLRGLRLINHWDSTKLADQVAQGLPPKPHHARAERLRWQGHALVIFMRPETEPLHDDYRRLAAIVAYRSGGRIPVYVHYPQLGWFCYDTEQEKRGGETLACLWRALPQAPRLRGMRGMVVGLPGEGFTLRASNWAPSALLAAWIPGSDLAGYLKPNWPSLPLVMWDHGSRLQRQRRLCPLVANPLQVQQLLAIMALAVVVDAPLLRALRLLLGLPASTEVQVWGGGEVGNARFAIAIKGARRDQAIQRLQTDVPLPIRQQAAAIIAAHHHPDHSNLSFEIMLEEAQLAQLYAPGADVIDPAPWFQAMANELYRSNTSSGQRSSPTEPQGEQQAEPRTELRAYLKRQGHRTAGTAWQKATAFTTTWALANPQAILQGKDLPADFDLQILPRLRQLLNHEAPGEPSTQGFRLFLEDDTLIAEVCPLETLRSRPQQGRDVLAQWASPLLLKWRRQGQSQSTWHGPLHASEFGRIELSQHAPLELEDGQTRCLIQLEQRPRWALEWGRSRDGLFVLVPNPWGEPERMPWPLAGQVGYSKSFPLPEPVAPARSKPGRSGKQGAQPDVPRVTITALKLELDAKGPLASLTLRGPNGSYTQGFRYIAPGEFVMGSPVSETEHDYHKWFDNERPQHTVTISHGLWLANTSCTQGFWGALMGAEATDLDPKRIAGPEYPVANVSWDMIQPFLQALCQLLPGKFVTLPTEAEWEYACRAGTTTAFSFGENINPAQVNYDGNYPFKGTLKGEYRGGTVPVNKLNNNDWGLYQMHGNVWEWCADSLRKYIAGPLIDPGLSEALKPSGDIIARVLRGGGWVDRALYARSAFRYHSAPIGLNDSTGFRFALRDFRHAS